MSVAAMRSFRAAGYGLGMAMLLLSAQGVSAADSNINKNTGRGGVVSSASTTVTGIDWASYQGKVVLVDFWASWCEPCRQSFPWMQAMQQKYADQGLVIIAVNVDREPAKAAAFLQTHPANFAIRYDPEGRLAKQFNVQGMPSSFVLGRDGKPAAKHQGFFQAKQASYEAELVRLLRAQ